MKPFINDDFLLTTDAARELFHSYAEKMPIIDYHCHLPPAEIAEDKRWDNIAQVWLGGDHYKWRQMRTNGFAERFCSGRKSKNITQRTPTIRRAIIITCDGAKVSVGLLSFSLLSYYF